MNKTDLIAVVAKRLKAERRDVGPVVNATIDAIRDAVAKGDRVTLADFGTFHKQRRAARLGRNPHTGEAVKIGATTKPAFKPGRAFVAQVAPKKKKRKPVARKTARRKR